MLRCLIVLLIIFFSTAKVKAQDRVSLLDTITVLVKAQAKYEISNSYFSFLDEIKYYNWVYTKKISRVKSTLKTSGIILHNYTLGLEYKNYAVLFDVATSEISPFEIKGDYKDESDSSIGELKRSVLNYTISFRYKWKILNLRFGYESNEINLDGVGTVNPNTGRTLLDGKYNLTSLIAGGGIEFKFKGFKMTHNLFTSVRGKLNSNFSVADTTLLGQEQHIVYSQKYKSFNGNVRTLSYIAELKYEFKRVAVMLLYEYNFIKGKGIIEDTSYRGDVNKSDGTFKETSHRIGIGFMLSL